MYTRDSLPRNYTVYNPERILVPGYARVVMHRNIPQTWAVVRPGSSPDPNGAPYYISGYRENQLIRAGAMQISPAKPRLEMDPSDSGTWQRQYVFT